MMGDIDDTANAVPVLADDHRTRKTKSVPARGIPRAGAFRPLLVATVCLVWVVANGMWLVQHRAGQLLNIDETGYLGIALNYSYAWERGGFPEWVNALLTPSQHAPVTTAVTSLPFLLLHRPMFVAFGVILAFAILALVLTAAYAALLGNRWLLLAVLALVATTPGFISLSRNFTFAVPVTAVTMGALYSLARSRGLLSVPWSILMGVSLGLMPLTRTMTIAFVPVILVAAALHAVGHEGRQRRRFANLALATVVAAIVMGIWLVPSAHLVFGYLLKYGYGSHAAEYTNHIAFPPLALLSTVSAEYQLPHMLLLAVGGTALAVVGIVSVARRFTWSRVRILLASPLSPLALFVLGAVAALMTSRNGGFGFTIPLLPPAALLAAAGWSLLFRRIANAGWRRAAACVVPVVCAVLVYPSFDSRSVLAAPRSLQFFGTSLSVSSGRGLDPAYQSSSAVNRPEWIHSWDSSFDRLTSDVLDGAPSHRTVAFGFRGLFTNVNVVELRAVERLHYGILAAQIDPVLVEDTVPAYFQWLTTGDAAPACHLMTSAGTVNEFTPVISTTAMEAAATEAGFAPVDHVATPDGRSVTVWERTGHGC